MSKWEDEFELDEEPQRKKPKPAKPNRNSTLNQDFEDLEDEPKNVKLPTIAKNPPTTNDKNAKSAANIALADIPKRRTEPQQPSKPAKYEEEEENYQLEESLAPSPKKSPKKEQKKTVSPKKEEKPEEDAYANEEFEEDHYDEDFEVHEESKPSPQNHKPSPPTTKPKEQPKPSKANLPKPAPPRKGAESLAKKPEVKGNSRNSVRSQSASRSAQNSRAKEEKKEEASNKYSTLAEKTCPSYERSTLEECNLDRLTRENDKIRGLIKRFNDELNELINRNIMQLKGKKEEKVVAAEDTLKVLEEQRSSNETALQTTLKELQRLRGKEGEIKDDYHLTLDDKIAEVRDAQAECAKNITRLKLEVANEGNRLSKIDKEKDGSGTASQEAGNVKVALIAAKKDEEKNDQILEKLYIKFEELTKRISDSEGKYNMQLEEAKNKGLSVQNNPELVRKAEELRKKIENCRLHKSKTESLFKTKCEMVTHECDQVRIQARAIDASTQACANNCEEIQNESKKIVEKARKTGKLSEDLLTTLDNIISELENGTGTNRDKEDASTFSHPKGAKKYQSQKNVEKLIPTPPAKEQTQDESMKKPTLFKKKEKEDEKQDERVWKDDKNNEPKKPEKTSPIPELAKFENKEEVEKKDDDKKKPFTIKRNKESKPDPEPLPEPAPKEEPKIEKIEVKKEKQNDKNQEIPSIAPRMMKFRRNKDESKPEEPLKETIEKQKPLSIPSVPKEEPKQEDKPPQEQSEKPIFAPKRFNLKLKDRNNNEQNGYVATAIEKTVEKKEEPKPMQQFKPKGLTIDKEPFSLASEPLKTIDPKPIATEQQQKPKFNLRLRDRQRESNREAKLEPAQEPAKEAEPKIQISLDDKAKENNQYTNPYANAEAPKREREGPLRKQKPPQAAPKQNFNIYEQAEDITNVKELRVGESPKPAKFNSEEPNLQDLLGIKKNKQTVDEDLLVDAVGAKPKGKRESKKDTNFFGDLEL